ncbi:MAG: hypothetical protein PVI50_00010 [Gammaproteobacteria bacterium]|jgi:hypothetical protein
MNLVIRIAIGAGLFVAGYWLGREVGRAQSGQPDLQGTEGQESLQP